jgi:hypothetical protein
LTKKLSGPGLINKPKRTKRVRKPGDDEFGLQPRLTRRKTTGKRKGKPKKGKKSRGRRTKAKKDDAIEQIRTKAGDFLRACDKAPWDPIPHSAKTSAALDLVKKW